MSAPLTTDEILKYINNPNPRIEEAKKEHKKLLMHVHGIGVAEYLNKVEGLENEEKYKIRKRLARSNKDFFSSLFRPADKVFTAKGGSISYGIENETKRSELQSKILCIKDGLSLYKWLENIWMDKYAVDPNGLILIEHEIEEDGAKKCYPTYKSISTIRNYEQEGQSVEWVIFEPYKKDDKGGEYFRVYDASGDNTYLKDGDSLTLVVDESFDNPWGYVPAQIISDLVNPVTEFKKSSIYEQIELADEYLRENTIKTLFKYHHGFPMFWQYLQPCPVCKGVGQVNGTKCPQCNGSRYVSKKDVSDIFFVKVPEDKDSPNIAPDLAGYVVPPIETWGKMTEELKLLRDMLIYSHWGTVIQNDSTEKTATEVFVNAQPVEERLNKYSDSYQIVVKAIIDMVGKYYFADEYKETQFNAGRNYSIKGVTQLNKEYSDLKAAKSGEILLNNKLDELINAKYANDAYNLTINLKLAACEPFVHNTIDEVIKFGISEELYYRKVLFNDWYLTKTQDDIFKTDIQTLKEDLAKYTEQVLIKIKDNAKVQEGGGTK